MKEEISKVLEMVQAGTITAQEGQQLLEAMGAYEEPVSAGNGMASRKAAKLYVKVDSAGGDKVNVALPLKLSKSGLNLGFSIGNQYSGGALKGIDLEAVSYTHLDVYKRQVPMPPFRILNQSLACSFSLLAVSSKMAAIWL